MTYKEAAQTALDVQDACNLSGVAKSFAGPVMDALWAEVRRTDFAPYHVNNHPIVTLFIDKMASLNGIQTFESMDKVSDAYKAVYAIVAAEDTI